MENILRSSSRTDRTYPGREFGVMSPTTWRLADLFAKHHFLLNGLGWGGMPLHAVRKDLEDGRLSVLPIEDVPPDGLDCTDVGGVANEVATWTRRPVVHRSLEANSGGNGQSAETAGHQEEGETVGENLTGRRCFAVSTRRPHLFLCQDIPYPRKPSRMGSIGNPDGLVRKMPAIRIILAVRNIVPERGARSSAQALAEASSRAHFSCRRYSRRSSRAAGGSHLWVS